MVARDYNSTVPQGGENSVFDREVQIFIYRYLGPRNITERVV
jgi:hypothetical protein